MPELPRISGAEAIKAFGRAGFEKKRQRGSHVVLKKEGFPLHLCVPLHKELDRGILRSLIRDAGLTIEDFVSHL
ncbi:MAG: type II toxin-antitoxin system HicA family toxin [Planctomycetes bacterium]|nr:type II toxin-antitoxin system HicA family toxin [Planctomycetota bacterium]